MSETKKQPQKPKGAAAKSKAVKPTPAKPEPTATQFATPQPETDEQVAQRLMNDRGLGVIYQVGKYFFSDLQYAEQSYKRQGLQIKTYKK